jgi:hypothetical protein
VGVGVGVRGYAPQPPTPKPQSPIPNPQINGFYLIIKKIKNNYLKPKLTLLNN